MNRATRSAASCLFALGLLMVCGIPFAQAQLPTVEHYANVDAPTLTLSSDKIQVTATIRARFREKSSTNPGRAPLIIEGVLTLNTTTLWIGWVPLYRPDNYSNQPTEIKMNLDCFLPPLGPGNYTLKWKGRAVLGGSTGGGWDDSAIPSGEKWNKTVTFTTTASYPGAVRGSKIRLANETLFTKIMPSYGNSSNPYSGYSATMSGKFYVETTAQTLKGEFFAYDPSGNLLSSWSSTAQITSQGPFGSMMPPPAPTSVSFTVPLLTGVGYYANTYVWKGTHDGTTHLLWDLLMDPL